jgi:multiple antibiotic resistance protein
METLISAFITLCITLIPVTNPIGMAPIFLSFTESLSRKQRHRYAIKVAILAFLFLGGILVVGPFVMKFFGIKIEFIKISGGLLLTITGWQMLTNSKQESANTDKIKAIRALRKSAFFPLAFPVTVGSGSIAIVTALATSYSQELFSVTAIFSYSGGLSAIALDMFLVAICYGYSEEIFSVLGETGTEVITRISAFILVAIGIQVVWGGLQPIIIETAKIIPG